MEAWPGGQLERHVGLGGGGASGWPHPSLWLPSSYFVPGTPGSSARLLGLQAHLPPLQQQGAPAQGLAFTGCCGSCQCLCPPSLSNFLELREPAQRCQGGVPGEPACVLWACSSPSLPARSICTGIWGWVCVCCRLSQSSYYGWIIIAIVIPHNWTRLCCLQGTSMPMTSSDFRNTLQNRHS